MPFFPFRSSSVKAKGSAGSESSGGGGGGLFSKNGGSRRQGQVRTSASTSDPRRRRRLSPDGDVLPLASQGPMIKRQSRSRDPVPRPPPIRRGRSPPQRRSTYRSSISPPSQRGSSRDHQNRRPESPNRRRYSISELPRPPPFPSPVVGAPVQSRPPSSHSADRRKLGYAAITPVASAPLIPHHPAIHAGPPSHTGKPPRYSVSPQVTSPINPPRPQHAASHQTHHHGSKNPSNASPARSTSSSGEADGAEGIFKRFPNTLTTFKAVKELSKHADKAREWVEWFNNVNGAPDEIRLLSSKVKIAKDTVIQIQSSLEARPDLIEDESGQNLKMQIEEVIDGTSETLKKMSKLLSGFTAAAHQDGTALGRLEGFWQSCNYKSEGEGQIKATDAELQILLSELTTLMSNIYARALRVPGPSSLKGTSSINTASARSETVMKPQGTTSDSSIPVSAASQANNLNRPIISAPDTPPVSPDSTGKGEEGTKKRALRATYASQHHHGTNNDFNNHPPSYASLHPQQAAPMKTPLTPVSPSTDAANNVLPTPQVSTDGDRTPTDILLDATWEGNLRAVSDALQNASANSCDARGLTPLHLAAERDHMAVAMFLLDRSANVNARADGGCMPLHLAARYASAATVEMLIDRAGADPNSRTSDGRTPLHYATRSAEDGNEERREVIRTLRDMGADPTLATRKGETPRDVAQKRDYWDAAATLRRAERRWEEEHLQQGPLQRWFHKRGLMK